MGNKVQEFLNDKFGEVRATNENGIILFVASDIAKALKYSSTQKVTEKVDDEDKGKRSWVTLGGLQELTVINEGGLYQVISSITKKDKERYALARNFKRWITNEIIPTIRTTGGYVEENSEEEFVNKYFPSFSEEVKISMVQDLLKTNKKLQVKADNWDKFLDTNGTYSFTEVSKLISTKATDEGLDIKITSVKLTELLRSLGILSKVKSKNGYKNLPNKEYEDYFNVSTVDTQHGFNKSQTRVNAKGVSYIYDTVKREMVS